MFFCIHLISTYNDIRDNSILVQKQSEISWTIYNRFWNPLDRFLLSTIEILWRVSFSILFYFYFFILVSNNREFILDKLLLPLIFIVEENNHQSSKLNVFASERAIFRCIFLTKWKKEMRILRNWFLLIDVFILKINRCRKCWLKAWSEKIKVQSVMIIRGLIKNDYDFVNFFSTRYHMCSWYVKNNFMGNTQFFLLL